MISGVRRYLYEILYNLCDNAIRYNKEGGEVAINLGHQDGNIVLSVSDTGIGIPAEHQSRIFEPVSYTHLYSMYHHNGYEDNADAHLKRSIMGREVVVAVTDGRLDFGTWEQIFYGEFDGKRTKRIMIKIIGE